MAKKIILSAIICLLCTAAFAQVQNQTRLDSLFNIYERERVYVALFFYDNTLFSDFLENWDGTYCILLRDLTLYANNNAHFPKREITDEGFLFVEKWLAIEDKIEYFTPKGCDTDITVPEVVYQMKDGRKHFQGLLTHPAQFWGSLSSSGGCLFYYRLIRYLTRLEQQAVDAFFDEYERIVRQIEQTRN